MDSAALNKIVIAGGSGFVGTVLGKLTGTEMELVLKSRWVVPRRLMQEGYRFYFDSSDLAIRAVLHS